MFRHIREALFGIQPNDRILVFIFCQHCIAAIRTVDGACCCLCATEIPERAPDCFYQWSN